MPLPAVIPLVWSAAASMVGRAAVRAAALYVVRSAVTRAAVRRAATQVATRAKSPTTQLPLALTGGASRTTVVARLTGALTQLYNAIGAATIKLTLGAFASLVVLRYLMARFAAREETGEELSEDAVNDAIDIELRRFERLIQTQPMRSSETPENYADRMAIMAAAEDTTGPRVDPAERWR